MPPGAGARRSRRHSIETQQEDAHTWPRAPGRTPRKRKKRPHMDGAAHHNQRKWVIDAVSGKPTGGLRSTSSTCSTRTHDSERAFCGADSSIEERVSVGFYMKQRKNGFDVGTGCEPCKAFAPPFALRLSRDLEAGGKLAEAEEYRRLAETLRKETVQDRIGD